MPLGGCFACIVLGDRPKAGSLQVEPQCDLFGAGSCASRPSRKHCLKQSERSEQGFSVTFPRCASAQQRGGKEPCHKLLFAPGIP
jgi:hypothetical protein